MWQTIKEFRQNMAGRSLAARPGICGLMILGVLALPFAGAQAAQAQTAGPAQTGCKGVTLAVIPAQGVITDPGQTEGGHLWWQDTGTGTCIGTVIENVELTAAAPARTLRVIVYDAAEPGGLTVAKMQVTGGPGPQSRAFGIHQVFGGLTAVCLAATSPVVTSPDQPCVQFGQARPVQQFTQSAGSDQVLTGTPAWPLTGWDQPQWWP